MTITETVWFKSGGIYDENAEDFIEELLDAMDKIPEKYRGKATIELRSDSDGYVSMSIEYERRMTKEEIAQERKDRAERASRDEREQKQAYEELKKKFG